MSVEKYLRRIGIEKKEPPSLAFLKRLQLAHIYNIPFEDLDIPDGPRIELDIERIYDKILNRNRGGFCYELNGIFNWLLNELGFESYMLSAMVWGTETNRFGPEFDHMTLKVCLGNKYLVDVGFGDSFRTPIQFPNGETEDISGKYRLLSERTVYQLQKYVDDKWNPQFEFREIHRDLNEFQEMCAYQQDNLESHFRTRMLCTKATETGRVTLTDSSLTITNNGQKTKIDLHSKIEFDSWLKEYFEIIL